jgi:methylmalonyl-CoA/ethylmalonyl-CoA epimerase
VDWFRRLPPRLLGANGNPAVEIKLPFQSLPPVLGKLNHVAVLVRDLPAAIARYKIAFGAKLIEEETLANGADIAVVEMGEMHLELLSTRQPDSKVAKLLDELGEGIHHLSYGVEDIELAMERLRSAGLRFRDEVPRAGLHGRRIAFLEPEDTFGVLIELVGD